MASTDYVGQVQARMESLADGFMARAISLAQADMAVLDEQLEHARKKLRGEKGALVTASSALAPPSRAPLATITEASNSPRVEAAAAKPAPRAPPAAAAAARPSPITTNESDSVAKARALVESYTFKELQRELKSRELRAAGKKQELRDRLKDALLAENAPKHTCATKEEADATDPFWVTRNDKLEAEEAAALEEALDDGEYCAELSKMGVAGERLLVVGDGLEEGVPAPSQARPGTTRDEQRRLDVLAQLTGRGNRPQNEAAFAEGGRVQILERSGVRTLGTIVDVIEGEVTAINISRGRRGLDAWQLHTLYTYNVRRDDGEIDYAVEESSLVAFVPPERLGRRRSQVAGSDSDSDEYNPRGTQSRRRSVRVDRIRARQEPDSYQPDLDGDEDDEEPLGDGEESDDDLDDNYGDPTAISRKFTSDYIENTVTELVCDGEPEIVAAVVPQT